MKEADGVALERLPLGPGALDIRKTRDAVAIGLEPVAPRWRIAAGSGTSVQEVNQLIKQFQQAQRMMKKLTKQKTPGNFGDFRGLFK